MMLVELDLELVKLAMERIRRSVRPDPRDQKVVKLYINTNVAERRLKRNLAKCANE